MFAEFFGGIVIIAVVATGFTLLSGSRELERLQREHPAPRAVKKRLIIDECPACGMAAQEP